MSWQLSTPLDPGDFSLGTYDEVRIVRQHHDSVRSFITLDLEYGTTVSGEWITDIQPASKQNNVFISDNAYTDLVTNAVTNDGETTYDAVKRGLYEWLYTNNFIASGVVV
jgi:hypothetical protein